MFLRSKRLFLRPFWPEEGAGEHTLAITLPDAATRGTCPPIIGVARFERLGGLAEIDLAIAPEWRRQGFATEAGRALVEWARTLGHVGVIAPRRNANSAAQRLCTRLGLACDDTPAGPIWARAA